VVALPTACGGLYRCVDKAMGKGLDPVFERIWGSIRVWEDGNRGK